MPDVPDRQIPVLPYANVPRQALPWARVVIAAILGWLVLLGGVAVDSYRRRGDPLQAWDPWETFVAHALVATFVYVGFLALGSLIAWNAMRHRRGDRQAK